MNFDKLVQEVHKKDKETLKIIHGFVSNIFNFFHQPSYKKISISTKTVKEHILPFEEAITLMKELKFVQSKTHFELPNQMNFKKFEKIYHSFNKSMKNLQEEDRIRSVISVFVNDPKEEDFTDAIKATSYGKELYDCFTLTQQCKTFLKQKSYRKALESFCEAFLINDFMSSISEQEFEQLNEFVQKTSSDNDIYIIIFVIRMAAGNPMIMKQILGYFDLLVKQGTKYTLQLLKLKAAYCAILRDWKTCIQSLNLYSQLNSIDFVLDELGMSYMQIKDYKKSFMYLTEYVNKSEWTDRSRVNAHYKLAYHYLSFEEFCDSPKNPEKNCESFIFHMRCAMIAENYQLPISNPFKVESDEIATFCYHQYLFQLENVCNGCGKSAKTRCSICNYCWYCSDECQKEDWKIHKLMCVKHQKPVKMIDVIKNGNSKSEYQRLMMIESSKIVKEMTIKCLPTLKLRFEKILETIGEPTSKTK
jgi:hypothetical protein